MHWIDSFPKALQSKKDLIALILTANRGISLD